MVEPIMISTTHHKETYCSNYCCCCCCCFVPCLPFKPFKTASEAAAHVSILVWPVLYCWCGGLDYSWLLP